MTLTPFTMTIGNEARDASDGETLESLAPFPQTPWATYPAASAADVDEAVRSAHDAWTNSWWRHDPRRRSQALLHLADLVDTAAPRLGDIESVDCGKAMREAQGVAGAMSGFFRYAAALCLAHPTGSIQQGSTPQSVQHAVRQPYGVIAVQVPWNQPLGVLVQETVMALAAGNAVVVKPSEFNPCSVLEFGTIIRESQLPPGIFNVISGLGPVAGAALCEHPLVRKIVFTGGGEAARIIARAAAERLVPLVLELGGKSPTLVFDDANLDLAAQGIVAGFTGGTGQSCTAASRTLVHRPVYDTFAEKLVAAAKGVTIGDPADPTIAMGPLTSAEHHARVTSRVRAAVGEGARLLHGGGPPPAPSPVADHPLFFEPTVFADVVPSMTIFREEVFGPVTCLVPFEDEKEAIAIANDTAFGLTASMWTNDVNRINRLVGELHAGTVWVNGHRAGDPSYAFGGLGESGYGRLNGIAGYEEMTYLKSVRWAFQPGGELTPVEPDEDQEYLASHERYADLRAEPGLATDDGGTRILTRHADVTEALREVEVFGGSMGYNADLPEEEQILPSIPEPRHGKIRRVINGVIAPHRLKPVEPYVRDLTQEILSEIVTGAPVDVVPTFVDVVPTRAMTFTFGIPQDQAARFGRMSDEMVERQVKVVENGLGGIHPEFTGYVDAIVADRRRMADPPDDLITRLMHADIDGEPLSDTAVRTQLMIMILAGNETTRNLLGNLVYSLARAPELFAELRRDPSTVADALVDESLRLDAPVQMLFRTCMRPTAIGDEALDEGQVNMLCLGSANRDSAVFDDPDEFRLDRDNVRDHLAFGVGPHVCPGSTLARMEARIVLEELADRVSAIRPARGYEPEFGTFFVTKGLSHLWLELDPS